METFYSRVLQGKFKVELLNHEFDDAVDRWHEHPSKHKLHDFLGMPEDVFNQVVVDPLYLKTIHNKRDLTVEELIAILKTKPQKSKVVYDSGQELSASGVEYDAEMEWTTVNL